ncbi:exodeoxyribonuclease VII large subunit, partial [Corallococcus carmarthensis]|nr:exodeoxyribonuclease VII large subunit [Corallococcus carmarthensis]
LLQQRLQGVHPGRKVESFQERIIQQERLLKSNMANIYDNKMAKADKLIEALTMLDTSRIVARGYAMIRQDGRVIDSVENVQMGENLTIQMKDGQLDVEVKHVQTDENI